MTKTHFKNLSAFRSSIWITFIGLAFGFGVGYIYSGNWEGAFSALLLTAVLAVLEVSLSFDNAVVNASILREMTPQWRHRFMTWGMLIAVFGMRIIFPLVIVSVIAHIDPWSALVLATRRPHDYAKIMTASHLPLAAFGGAFLLMVALSYFLNHKKSVHWLEILERGLARLGKIEAIEIGLSLLFVYGLSRLLSVEADRITFLTAGIFGVITYIFVDGLSAFLRHGEEGETSTSRHIEKASAALFLYLEVLDASFSFDGVIGAFALTNNLLIIASGLGIGAMYVRSMTLFLVEKGTLAHYRYLEHGAFYAIGALGLLMLLDVFFHIPEAATGLLGGAIILCALYSSIRYSRRKI